MKEYITMAGDQVISLAENWGTQYELQVVEDNRSTMSAPEGFELWANEDVEQGEKFIGNNDRWTDTDIKGAVISFAKEVIENGSETDPWEGWTFEAYCPDTNQAIFKIRAVELESEDGITVARLVDHFAGMACDTISRKPGESLEDFKIRAKDGWTFELDDPDTCWIVELNDEDGNNPIEIARSKDWAEDDGIPHEAIR